MSKRSRMKQTPVLRQGEPLPSLPTDEIVFPHGLLWQNDDYRPLLLLACLFREIRRVPEAAEELEACNAQWHKTVGSKFRRFQRIGREAFNPAQLEQPQGDAIDRNTLADKIWNPLAAKMVDQCGFDEEAPAKDLQDALGTWVNKWACGSWAMTLLIHHKWLNQLGREEQYNTQRRFYNRAIKGALQPNSVFKKNIEHIADSAMGEREKFWKVLMSPELKRCDGAARDEARRGAHEQRYSCMYETNLMRLVWCFVQYELLRKRVEQIAADRDAETRNVPLNTLYDNRNRDKYFRPFYEALALYGPITKRHADKVKIDYTEQTEPQNSQNLASQMH